MHVEVDQIYEKDMLHSHITNITDLQSTWQDFRSWVNKFKIRAKRNYTPIKQERPLLLILISNIFIDRYFPDVWRNLLCPDLYELENSIQK